MAEAISAVRRAIEAGGLIPDGATVLAAVSGGVDSIVLLDVLARLAPTHRWRVVVGHVDHRLRGAISSEDARFVATEAARRGLAGEVGALDVKERARREKGGLAAVARAARYEWLARVARREEASVVVTGHTANDQAETLLLRLLRGTGARGLGGIPPRRRLARGIEVVRPMLGLTREDVLAHAKRFKLSWREDVSNANPARMRNRVRLELIPLLRGFQPDVVRVLARAATQSAEAARVVGRAARHAFLRVAIARDPGRVSLSRAAWLALPPELGALVMRLALAHARGDAGTKTAQVEAACAAGRKGRGRAIVEDAEVKATRETIEVRRTT